MTNSIASAKCPSVLTSGNYGMSQNRYTDDSKEYIFVKLTDSAYRAVEEYQRNENGRRFLHGQCAKIQFIGNSGIIHFPTPDNGDSANGGGGGGGGGRQFGFAIDDVEGSLECIQQKQNELDVLGSLSYRMRIQANEDVYDTTRTKMAIAEETEKSKCIREIKPNQTDIGRKVKKQPLSFNHNQHHNQHQQQQQHHHLQSHAGNANNISNSSNSNINNRNKGTSPLNGNIGNSIKLSTSRSPNPTMLGGSGTINNAQRYGSNISSVLSNQAASIRNGPSISTLTSASSLSSTLADGIVNGYAAVSTSSGESTSASASKKLKLGNSPNSNSNFRGTNNDLSAYSGSKSLFGGSNTSNGSNKNSNSFNGAKVPDICRRNIRERLIHLLALKPFKKPELYARLQNEGLRERERSVISNILKDISTMSRDNTYNLRRQMWNDVNENWPFYTEQELQLLKRRKPQNLTPPVSSDAGSSTSGQSPTSTHTGSPPPLVSNIMADGSNNNSSLKRNMEAGDRYDETLLSSVQPKKQRISHYKKDSLAPSSNAFVNSSRPGFSSSSSSLLGKGTSFSPSQQSSTSQAVNEDHFGESDLSYNILDNADDFMSHLEKNNGFYNNVSASRKTGSVTSNANAPASNPLSPRSDKFRKAHLLENSPSSLYAGSFIPESKTSSNRSSSTNNNGFFQRQSPNYAQQNHKTNGANNSINRNTSHSGIVNSPRSSCSPRDEVNNRIVSGISTGSTNEINNKQSTRFHNKSSRTPTPPMRQHMPPNEVSSSTHFDQQHQQQHQQPANSQINQLPQQLQHSSPTQQIADAASKYTSAASAAFSSGNKPLYDFSNYTPITTIEQRRQYKTEFESDYDEYLKLLKQIESVGRRFRGLAERLENVRQGCPEFNDIKQQIVSEYERIRNAETLKRDKQRFDYLHEKLAYIKQLVTDYDKTLTSGSNSGSTTSLSSLMNSTTRSPEQESVNVTHQNEQPSSHPYLQQQQQHHHRHYNYQDTMQQQHNTQRTQQHPHPQSQPQLATTSPLHFSSEDHLMSSHHEQTQREYNQHYMLSGAVRTLNSHTNDPPNSNHRSAVAPQSRNESNSDDSSDSNDDDNDNDGEDDNDNDNEDDENYSYSNSHDDDNPDRF